MDSDEFQNDFQIEFDHKILGERKQGVTASGNGNFSAFLENQFDLRNIKVY